MALRLSAASMQLRIWLHSGPPPIASKARVAPVVATAFVKSSVNAGELLSTTWTAPSLRRIAACAGLRTTFTSATPS